MNERTTEAIKLYRTHRAEVQRQFYVDRINEYRTARNQARTSAAVFLVLAAIAGALASADVRGWRQWWAVAAAVLGAIASAVTGFESSYGFDRLARNYEKTVAALALAMSQFPGNGCADSAEDDTTVTTAVAKVEGVLLTEVDQWARQTAVQTSPPENGTVAPSNSD
jgi:hypothetical protein